MSLLQTITILIEPYDQKLVKFVIIRIFSKRARFITNFSTNYDEL